MKPSYYETPRTLDEATFYVWGDPITPPETPRTHPADKVLYALGVISCVIVFWVLA